MFLFSPLLAGIGYTGAFSRFTHGRYTPRWYQYQEYHQVDDGGTTARAVPILDVILASLVLWRPTRLVATILIDLIFIMGTVMQVRAGKRFELDMMTVAIASMAVFEAS